jgi:uncharacterized protein DUF4190/uncharacterized protein DUF4339
MSATYKIIGHDGKEYGPVTAEQMRQWIAEGRLERQTPVFAEGAKDWNFVGLLPEFAAGFAGSPPVIGPLRYGDSSSGQIRKTNFFATAGLVCGILSVTLCCCCGGLPVNLLGLIFSIIALVQISERPETENGRALAIIGLVLSGISLLILFIEAASGHTQTNFNIGQF